MNKFIIALLFSLFSPTLCPGEEISTPGVTRAIMEEKTIGRVDTIAELRFLSGNNPGQLVQVAGYFTAGDGGGGPVRRWSPASTCVDNGGSCIDPAEAGAGRWIFPQANSVDVRNYGALPSDGVDDTAIIQYLINTLPSYSEIIFSGGTFNVSTTINITRPDIALIGSGPTSTLILRTNGTYGDTFFIASATPATVALSNISLKNMRIQCNALMTSGAHVHVQETSMGRFSDLTLFNGFKGFYLQGCRTSIFENTIIQSGSYTATVQAGSAYVHLGLPVSATGENTELIFSDFNWEYAANSNATENGLVINECDGVWFNNGHIFGAANAVTAITSSSTSLQLIGVTFNQVWFDQRCSKNVQISGTGRNFGNITFNACRFWGAADYALFVTGSSTLQDVEFNACEFGMSNAARAVELLSGHTLSFTGSKFAQINQKKLSTTASYLRVPAASSLIALNVKSCTLKGTAAVKYGLELLNQNCRYGVTGNQFTAFALSAGSEEIKLAITGNKAIGQFRNNTTDRTFALSAASLITAPPIMETITLTGGSASIDNIFPAWDGRTVTLRADTAAQTLTEAGNIATAAGGKYVIPATRSATLTYFLLNGGWVQK